MNDLFNALIGIAVGAAIVVPLYLFFFGGLEWLLKRDEQGPVINSFKSTNKRSSDE